jgi:hypothetical protein
LVASSSVIARAQAEGLEAPTPEVATPPDAIATAPSDDSWTLQPPKVFGFLQVHYRNSLHTGVDTPANAGVDNDNFRVQRARVGVKGRVLPWLGYQVVIDPRAPEVGGIMRDAYLTLHVIPRHKLRIGQQKMQFGYENRESSTRLYAVNRTEVSDNLSRGPNLRDIGLGLLGNIKLGNGFRFEDAITLGNGARINAQDDDTAAMNLWGRLGVRYKHDHSNLTARLGVSGAIGDMMDEGDDPVDPTDDYRLKFKRLGVDLEVDQRWFFLASEFVIGWDENASTQERETLNGYYVAIAGKTPWDVGPIVRYDVTGDTFERWTFGAYYGPPGAPFRVMLNYELRLRMEEVRSDDKFYVWMQTVF